jgi:hypothetical protein
VRWGEFVDEGCGDLHYGAMALSGVCGAEVGVRVGVRVGSLGLGLGGLRWRESGERWKNDQNIGQPVPLCSKGALGSSTTNNSGAATAYQHNNSTVATASSQHASNLTLT